jgi:hypothetical protein
MKKVYGMGAFLQALRLTSNWSRKLVNEFDLIEAAFIMDECMAIGFDVTSEEDILESLSLFNRWRVIPNIFCLCNKGVTTTVPKQLILKFMLQMYILLRYLSLLMGEGVNSIMQQSTWRFTGQNIPGEELIKRCFDGIFDADISGDRSYWLWPSSSAALKEGKLSIMRIDKNKRNWWNMQVKAETLKVRGSIVFVEDEEIIMPQLLEEGYDACIVSFEPNLVRATEKALYHKEAIPPIDKYYGEALYEKLNSIGGLFPSILYGGQPLYGGNVLVEMQYDNFDYGRTEPVKEVTLDANILDIINRAITREANERDDSKSMYLGATDIEMLAKLAKQEAAKGRKLSDVVKDLLDEVNGE